MERIEKTTTIRLTASDQEILEKLKLSTGLRSAQIIRVALRRLLRELIPGES